MDFLMSDILIISDIHGAIFWKKILNKRKTGDIVVFLGDYFDKCGRYPCADNELDNFLEICGYARNNPGTYLLLGNHDYDYLPWAKNFSENPNYEYQKALLKNMDILSIVHVIGKNIFSHAGITNTFMFLHNLKHPAELNCLFSLKPECFDWIEADPITGVSSTSTGDDIWQSPIWTRTFALQTDGLKGYSQIVGHTPVRDAGYLKTDYGNKILMTCDFSNEILKISI